MLFRPVFRITLSSATVNNKFSGIGGEFMHNLDIRQAAKAAGIKLYQIAAEIGLNDGNFSRRLRRELPDTEKQKIFEIIAKLSSERSDNNAKADV